MLGRSIEQYRIDALIGEGAQGGVYRAVHGSLGSVHALKIPWLESEEARAALLREGRVQASVRHPNLVGVTDVIGGEVPALVLEYVTGPTLAAWLARSQDALPLSTAVKLFRSVVDGVHALHRAGLIHGDLKPANILLAPTPDGWQPKITDFGLARLCAGGGDSTAALERAPTAGTGGYMSPEQVVGDRVDHRADLFALGCVLYEMLTGRPPFPGDDPIAQARATVAGLPAGALLAVPEALRSVVGGLLERDPERRTPSCEVLSEQLDRRIGAEDSLVARFATPIPPPVRRQRPHRCAGRPLAAVAAGGALVGAALGAVVLGWSGLLAAPLQPPAAVATTPPVEAVAALVSSPPADVREVEVREVDVPPVVAPGPSRAGNPGPPREIAPTTRVSVEGDAVVTLTDSAGRLVRPGPVPPGRYRVSAQFGGVAGPSYMLSLRSGESAVVRCESFAMRCNITTR
jgi:hypothetical protein